MLGGRKRLPPPNSRLAALPAGLANICHTRGIEVIEAMPKPSGDIDEPGVEPAPPTIVRRA